jgi:hypothetical protein
MNNKTKQSSVEYYAKQLEILADKVFKIGLTLDEFHIKKHELLNQAKKMEKEQIIDAFEQGENNSVDYFNPENIIKESEQYYNETYGGNK